MAKVEALENEIASKERLIEALQAHIDSLTAALALANKREERHLAMLDRLIPPAGRPEITLGTRNSGGGNTDA